MSSAIANNGVETASTESRTWKDRHAHTTRTPLAGASSSVPSGTSIPPKAHNVPAQRFVFDSCTGCKRITSGPRIAPGRADSARGTARVFVDLSFKVRTVLSLSPSALLRRKDTGAGSHGLVTVRSEHHGPAFNGLSRQSWVGETGPHFVRYSSPRTSCA